MSARTRLLAAALAAVVAMLAGCASVPTEGPVRSGVDAADRRGDAIDLPAERPRPGATPRAIVSGFIEAMASSTDIARLYLTTQAAKDWRPETKTTIFDGTDKSVYRVTGGKNVVLEAPEVATLDKRGAWSNAAPSTTLELDFNIVTENGEWRISEPPDGTLLEKTLLTVYQQRDLYFFTPGMDALVPEQVYLPRRVDGGQDATQLVRALLTGPTERLGDAVRTAIPDGTDVVSVPIGADGTATVSLNDRVSGLDADQRSKLAAQLARTLKQVPGVSKIQLIANGAPFEVGGTTGAQPIDNWQHFDAAYTASRGRLYIVDAASGVSRIDDVTALGQTPALNKLTGLESYGKESLAVDVDARNGAAVTNQNVVVGAMEPERPTEAEKVPTDGEVLRPSYDMDGNLWVVDRADQARIRVRRPDGDLLVVKAPSLSGRSLKAFRVARDGVRMLAIIAGPQRDMLVTGRITRTDRMVTISGVEPVPVSFSRLTDVGWSRPTKLVLLGGSGELNQMQELNVDGSEAAPIPTTSVQAENAPIVFNPVELATAPNVESLLAVRNASGEVLIRQRDLTWRVLLKKGTPLYPG